ncbi:MAG: iron-sulfur cluster assembly accessory protein [Thermoflexibacter sp.]|jgi:iron-sulfur cluster assembly protein|nr:iron-sulfur cluster assembly accessory protein [Thermoflexibacter sp.]
MLQPIRITNKAAQEIKYIMAHKNIPQGYGLRVLVQGGGGCGGAKFRLGFDKLKEGDMQYITEDIPVYYEKKQLMYLMGLEIDFEERTDARGFVFNAIPHQ